MDRLTSLFKFFVFTIIISLILNPTHSFAQDNKTLPVVSVINPIRGNELGLEKIDLLNSLRGQWEVTKDFNIPATWLWQYSALENNQLTSFAKKEMRGQEFGIFLEVDRNLASKAGVLYRGRGPWYFSDGLYLLSYDPIERKKLIDTTFSLFHKQFGYYPSSVGAWWVTSDTLSYIHGRYGVISLLRAADQFDLDVYSFWGTPWSIPYISSSENAGIPALDIPRSSHVVIMQWAARDPLNGYGDSFHSTYSLQDYNLRGYDIDYFEYLLGSYLKKPLDHLVIGLEGGSSKIGYEGEYKKHLVSVTKLRDEKKLRIESAGKFASQFIEAGKTVVRPYMLTTDYNTDSQSFWYNTPYLRLGVQKRDGVISIVDLREYLDAGSGDYNVLPNSQGYLRINIPSVIDSARFPGQSRVLVKTSEPLVVEEKGDEVVLKAGSQELIKFTPNDIHFLVSSSKLPDISLNKSEINSTNSRVILGLTLFYLGYLIFIFKKYKISKTRSVHILFLLLPLIFASKTLTNAVYFPDLFLFDKKQFLFSPLLVIPIFSLANRIFIMLTVLPLLAIPITHYLLVIRSYKNSKMIVFMIISFILSLIFVRIPYFPIDKSTYVYLVVFFVIIMAIGGISIFYFYLKSKSLKFTSILILVELVALMIIGITIFISRTQYIISPFEIQSVNFIERKNKDIFYVTPPVEPIYKAIQPVLLDDDYVIRLLIGKSWQNIVPGKYDTILKSKNEYLLVVPRYLGSDFENKQVEKFGLVKLFDNGNVVIYGRE